MTRIDPELELSGSHIQAVIELMQSWGCDFQEAIRRCVRLGHFLNQAAIENQVVILADRDDTSDQLVVGLFNDVAAGRVGGEKGIRDSSSSEGPDPNLSAKGLPEEDTEKE